MTDERVVARLMQPVDKFDHSMGPEDASATLVQYGDYECPYCRELHPLVQELMRRTDGLRFVYRHFPLVMHHPFAARAAEAAEAGGAQGKFWEMHGQLYEAKQPLEEPRLTHAARSAGLDMNQYQAEMAENTYAARVQESYRSALYGGGVTGTPTLFLNGALLAAIHTLDELIEAVTGAGAALKGKAHEHADWRERLRNFRLRCTRVPG